MFIVRASERCAVCTEDLCMLAAGSLEGFEVNRRLQAVLRWTAARAEGDAWLAVAERDTREPVQAAVKARLLAHQIDCHVPRMPRADLLTCVCAQHHPPQTNRRLYVTGLHVLPNAVRTLSTVPLMDMGEEYRSIQCC